MVNERLKANAHPPHNHLEQLHCGYEKVWKSGAGGEPSHRRGFSVCALPGSQQNPKFFNLPPALVIDA